MWNRKRSVALSLAVCYLLSAVVAVLLFTAPNIFLDYLTSFRNVNELSVLKLLISVFCGCFYPSAVLALTALYLLIRILYNIKKDDIFIMKNVSYLRRLSWCCIGVSVITFVGGFFYIPFLFITAAAGFMAMILRVLKNVMQSAVEIREENDLTI